MGAQAALRLYAVAIALATLYAYTGLRDARFVTYDTPDYVLENPHVRAGLTSDGLVWAFTNTEQANYHPLTWLSHMADVELFGLDPLRHKLVNLTLHLAASLLLLFSLAAWTGAPGRSAFVAGVFALHPTHVESVAWVAERKDVLAALFWMASLAAYAGWVRRRGAGRYALALTCFAAALLAKPMAVTLPFALLLLDYWPLERPLADWRRLVLEKLPFFALSAALSLVTFVAQRDEGAMATHFSLTVRVATAAVAYVAYLWKAVWPVDLAVLYPHPGAPPWWQPLLAVLLLAALTRGVLYESLRRPWLATGWFWYLGTLVPVIGLVQVGAQWIADRYTYLPYVGLGIAVAWGAVDLASLRPAARRTLPLVAAAVLAAFTLGTRAQLRYWTDTYTLFSRALELTERNWVAHGLVGVELYNRGELEAAIANLQRSVEIRPDHLRARANLGAALLEAGRVEQAEVQLREAERLDPDDLDTRFQLARLSERRGQLDAALAGYAVLLAHEPEYAPALRRTGLVHYQRGELGEAERWLRRALEVEPGSAAGHAYLGRVLEESGRRRDAIASYRRALRLQPDQPLARRRLAALAHGGARP